MAQFIWRALRAHILKVNSRELSQHGIYAQIRMRVGDTRFSLRIYGCHRPEQPRTNNVTTVVMPSLANDAEGSLGGGRALLSGSLLREMEGRFSLITPLDKVNIAAHTDASEQRDTGQLHWGGGTQTAVVVIFGTDQVGQLPGGIAVLMLPLLRANGVVNFVVKASRRSGNNADSTPEEAPLLFMVEVEVTLLDRSWLHVTRHATAVRRLYAASKSLSCRYGRDSEGARLVGDTVGLEGEPAVLAMVSTRSFPIISRDTDSCVNTTI